MITEAELRRRAAQWRVDPMVVDLDYSLGWFLAGLLNSGLLGDRVPAYLEGRRKEFEQDWKLRLSYLVPTVDVDFPTAWTSTLDALEATVSNPPPNAT